MNWNSIYYHYGLSIFILLLWIFEFNCRLRNQRVSREGWAAASEGRLPTGSQSHGGSFQDQDVQLHVMWLSLVPKQSSSWVVKKNQSMGMRPLPETWKSLRSCLSKQATDDYAIWHVTRSVWLSEKLCYGLSLRDRSLSSNWLIFMRQTQWLM